jgi:hypothetical protein
MMHKGTLSSVAKITAASGLIVLATDGLLLGLFTKDCIDTFTTVPLVG